MEQELLVEPYGAERKSEWDAFVDASKNGTFLLRRDYMDYHADRFVDCSLMVCRGEKLVALLPASRHGDEVRSHGGLTYGGFIMPFGGEFSAATAVEALGLILEYYRKQGVERLIYKPIPHIYHRYPSEEDLYALFRCGGQLLECNVASTIDLSRPIRFNEGSRWHARKCAKLGVTVREESDFVAYWRLLSNLLRERYDTVPVHSIEEISLLKRRFPEAIRLFCAYDPEGELIAGTLLYFCGECVHSQYTAASDAGKKIGALAMIYDYVIREECAGARYFDFGTCNEDHGRYLNEGLLSQKNGMGGRAIAYPAYVLKTSR